MNDLFEVGYIKILKLQYWHNLKFYLHLDYKFRPEMPH